MRQRKTVLSIDKFRETGAFAVWHTPCCIINNPG